jgi:hypothetical protein
MRLGAIHFSGMGVAVALMALASSCKKEPLGNDPLPPVSDTPSISLKTVIPTTVKQLDDPIEFTIMYTDGNGDLGFYEADSHSVYVTDNRFPLTATFQLQPLAPMGTDISIQGELVVTLDDIILEDTSSTSEHATFTIKLRDRAGNWSNSVTSGIVTVVK